jgi:hypothetical protein
MVLEARQTMETSFDQTKNTLLFCFMCVLVFFTSNLFNTIRLSLFWCGKTHDPPSRVARMAR